ncbi:Cobyrinic acid A,C-diamide synthase [compost metagenome]
MARSAAAIVKGFQLFSPDMRIVGVIANKAGSAGHYKMVKEAIEQECSIPVIGYLERDLQIGIPERHLGLVPSIGRGELDGFFTDLGELVASHIDLDKLIELADSPLQTCEPKLFVEQPRRLKPLRIAVAKDAAFHFYYPENLELLEAYGAQLQYFSPLAGEVVPANVDGLYIGGGFPEEFAEQLADHMDVKASFRERIQAGIPTLAECGGFMYLTDEIEDTQGNTYPMVGLIPGKVVMQKKLAALGYREINGTASNFLLGEGHTARGHEFHYSTFQPDAKLDLPRAFHTKGRLGTKLEGYTIANLVAGYTHVHFASDPGMVIRWLDACELYNKEK